MNASLIYTIITISSIGVAAAIILYFTARKFYVYEDPRIDEVEEALPAANCGGCGYAGCRAFAEAIVKDNSFDSKFCPVGGDEVMQIAAGIMGLEAGDQKARLAVLRCNGTCEFRPKTNHYEGASTCAIAAMNYGGETGCQYGCLGFDDCVDVCDFDALHMDPKTGLPVVADENCVGCGACIEACPKDLFELRKKMPKHRKIFVSCRNEDKGGVAKKSCEVACIGCGKCEKECKYDAITISNNLAFIDSDKCVLCRKCVSACPTNAIIEENFPPRKIKVEKEAQSAEA
ncbi:MAG: RnfABCDGE type electron transport complex subunit B [Prolixibacteraceae bacterium]|jgi:electron transport complex protein RnfB|nr:RnfABCDGE type electron transport complex subunit B [Prolixibacteraceae bacterium]